MVRLLRLASVDDGKFKTSFGNDIEIKPGSKLAVLNATFKTEFSKIAINGLNKKIQFIPDISNAVGLSLEDSTFNLDERTYSGTLGVSQFFRDVNLGLNGTLGYIDTTVAGGAKNNNGVFSEFQVQYEDNLASFPEPLNPVEIIYTYNLILSAFGPTWSLAYPQGSRNSPLLEDQGGGVGGYFDRTGAGATPEARLFSNQIQMKAGLAAVTGTTHRAEAAAGVVMSSGSGLWMARVGNFVDNGQGALAQNNGFGFGLSTNLFDLPTTSEISIADKYAEVRFNRAAETYKFSSNLTPDPIARGREQDSSVNPQRVTAAQPLSDHDIMWIRVGKNQRADQAVANDPTFGKYCIQAGVWVDMGASAVEHIFFSYELSGTDIQYNKLHPYFFMNGAAGTIFADAVAFTPSTTNLMDVNELQEPDWDPFEPTAPVGYTQIGKDNYQILNLLRDGGLAAFPLSVIGNITPYPMINRFDPNFTTTTELVMHRDVLNYMGFENLSADGYATVNLKIGADNLEYQNMIELIGKTGPNLDNDDNFIIESMTLPVDSYDASEQYYGDNNPLQQVGLIPSAERLGRRKNIIATIPVSDLNNLVQYEASTPQFVDLRNKSILNERNLEFRILDKNFNNIQTGTSKSILTLLLSGPDE